MVDVHHLGIRRAGGAKVLIYAFAHFPQMLCGVCGSYSGHLYERLANELGTENGLTMKGEFCTALTTACDGQIDFPDFDGMGYCTVLTGGGDEDLFWSYPYEESEYKHLLETSSLHLQFAVAAPSAIV